MQQTPERELGFVPCHVPDSFGDPLPDDELAAWEGLTPHRLPENPRLIGFHPARPGSGTPSALFSGESITRLP
jgi:hypothetical protein